MCLNAIHKEPKIAEEDIFCYKLLYKKKTKEGYVEYTSPIVYYSWFTATDDDVIPDSEHIFHAEGYQTLGFTTLFNGSPIGTHEITSGYFHTYQFRPRKDCYNINTWSLFKCAIPKGSKYYEGFGSGNNEPEYASEYLKIVEKIW